MTNAERKTFFSPKLYDRLKFVAQILLPALGTLWFAIGGIWHLEHTTEIVGTITAVDLFLGGILKVSSDTYYKDEANFQGDVHYIPEEDGGRVRFEFDRDPAEVIEDEPGRHSMEFRVKRDLKPREGE